MLKSIQEAAGVSAGDAINIDLEIDTSLEGAKRPQTRERRLAQAFQALRNAR